MNNFGICKDFVKLFDKGNNVVEAAETVVKHNVNGQKLLCCDVNNAIFVFECIIPVLNSADCHNENLRIENRSICNVAAKALIKRAEVCEANRALIHIINLQRGLIVGYVFKKT